MIGWALVPGSDERGIPSLSMAGRVACRRSASRTMLVRGAEPSSGPPMAFAAAAGREPQGRRPRRPDVGVSPEELAVWVVREGRGKPDDRVPFGKYAAAVLDLVRPSSAACCSPTRLISSLTSRLV